LVKIEHYD
jgi:hypothetical protein